MVVGLGSVVAVVLVGGTVSAGTSQDLVRRAGSTSGVEAAAVVAKSSTTSSPLAELAAVPAAVRTRIKRSIPKDQPAKGLVYSGLTAGVDGPCSGNFEITVKGKTRCTHGPDADWVGSGFDPKVPVPPVTKRAAAGPSSATAKAEAAPTVVPCAGTGTSGNRVQVLYVYSGTSRFSTYSSSLATWALGVDDIFNRSAQETGGVRHVRFLSTQTASGCAPTVTEVKISSSQLADIDAMESALVALGYNRSDRKYLTFADTDVYCGIADAPVDDRKTADNASNFGPTFARVDNGCWSPPIAAHELGHNLGAVQYSAPHTSGGGHCTDEWDLMCYSDEPNYPAMTTTCADKAHDDLFDCHHDDYSSTNPAAGSYLATHYNSADNTFLNSESLPSVATASPATTASPASTIPASSSPVATTSPTTAATSPVPTSPVPTSTATSTATSSPTASLTNPTPTATPLPATFSLMNFNSELCLGIRNDSRSKNISFTQSPCNPSSRTQQFTVRNGALVIAHSGMCMSIREKTTTTGGRVVQMPCDASNPSQQIWSSGRYLGFTFSGLCLDIQRASTAAGAPGIQQTCDARKSQQFTVV
ncbi:MAG TPA: RICIN domain-containing protein [Kineosporiaceae bacterium]|nr:RICIN domain-containing protein [Kineosporiaceae bacterium]